MSAVLPLRCKIFIQCLSRSVLSVQVVNERVRTACCFPSYSRLDVFRNTVVDLLVLSFLLCVLSSSSSSSIAVSKCCHY